MSAAIVIPIVKAGGLVLAFILSALGTGCSGGSDSPDAADGSVAGDAGGSDAAAAPDAGGLGGACKTFADCTDPDFPWCDETIGRCVLCATGGQCSSGICDTSTHRCAEAKPDGGGAADAGNVADGAADGGAGTDVGGPRDAGHYADFDAGIPADCTGATCSGRGTCSMESGKPRCTCEAGYVPVDREPLCAQDDACVGCSGRGKCMTWGAVSVCACDKGYTPTDNAGHDCRPTLESCTGGAVSWDWNDDGTVETRLDPTGDECWMFELINYTRAAHDPKGAPECHTPLLYSVEWSAHARNHSKKLQDRGALFHDDLHMPGSQNCAEGCGPDCEMYLYMNGAGEDHCPASTHHCGIMDCGITHVGVGYWPLDGGDYWNTQNFY